ncbi:MAG: hypothetical protein EOP58_15770, partial [Sphingomonadales bacterium]
GDVNGDGFDDFLVGAPNADPNGSNSGSVYLVLGRPGASPTAGDDVFYAQRGGLTIDGGAGTDTMVYAYARDSYTLTYLGNNQVRVTGPSSPEQIPTTDLLTNFERLQFADGTYAPPTSDAFFDPIAFGRAEFGTSPSGGGWVSYNSMPRTVGDMNGDGHDDIVGFGVNGTYYAQGRADGSFGESQFIEGLFGSAQSAGGWTSYDQFPRHLADVNGDGRDDLVGFGNNGVTVALANSTGSWDAAGRFQATTNFGASATAGGWSSNDRYPRVMGDVNGDGRMDIIGFGNAGTYVALAQADGRFGETYLALDHFGTSTAGGWASQDSHMRTAVDLNGDGRDDLVGFGAAGVYVALAQLDGRFSDPTLVLGSFGTSAGAGGWASNDSYPR